MLLAHRGYAEIARDTFVRMCYRRPMTMTREQRNSYRHMFECVRDSARKRAEETGEPYIVYRARNGFWMYGPEFGYKSRKGDNSHVILLPSAGDK